jgi:hypothetical protein
MAVEAVAGLSKSFFIYKAYLVGFCEAGQKFPKPFTLALPILLWVNLVYKIVLFSLFYYKIS